MFSRLSTVIFSIDVFCIAIPCSPVGGQRSLGRKCCPGGGGGFDGNHLQEYSVQLENVGVSVVPYGLQIVIDVSEEHAASVLAVSPKRYMRQEGDTARPLKPEFVVYCYSCKQL
jgi:hypothetical protein